MFSVLKLAAPKEFINDGFTMIPGGTAFIYLFRRYGYPNFYSYKTVAEYAVETAVVGVFVMFNINHKTCWIRATANEELYRKYGDEEVASRSNIRAGTGYSEFCRRVHNAVRDCLLDQLRPVNVNGERINILGPGTFEWSEEEEQMVGEVPYFELEAAS